MNKIVDPMCLTCFHLLGWEWPKCEAFPEGIPADILNGEFDHSKPHEGDHDVQYEYMFA